jgi:hypothetical protein
MGSRRCAGRAGSECTVTLLPKTAGGRSGGSLCWKGPPPVKAAAGAWRWAGRHTHPQANGKLERFYETLKARLNLLVYTSPEVLRVAMADFIRFYNYERYHEGIGTVTLADVYDGRGATPSSDDGRPNNAGRRPGACATIGRQACRARGAS